MCPFLSASCDLSFCLAGSGRHYRTPAAPGHLVVAAEFFLQFVGPPPQGCPCSRPAPLFRHLRFSHRFLRFSVLISPTSSLCFLHPGVVSASNSCLGHNTLEFSFYPFSDAVNSFACYIFSLQITAVFCACLGPD